MKAYEVTATRKSDGNEITRRIHAKDEKTAQELLEKLVNPAPGEAPPVPEVPHHGDGTTPVLPADMSTEDNQHPENTGKTTEELNEERDGPPGDHEINHNDGEAAENLIDGGENFDSSVHDNKDYPGARKKEPGLLPSEQPEGDHLGKGGGKGGKRGKRGAKAGEADAQSEPDEAAGDEADNEDAETDKDDAASRRMYGEPREGLSRRNSDEVKMDEEISRLASEQEMNPEESDLTAEELLDQLREDSEK